MEGGISFYLSIVFIAIIENGIGVGWIECLQTNRGINLNIDKLLQKALDSCKLTTLNV